METTRGLTTVLRRLLTIVMGLTGPIALFLQLMEQLVDFSPPRSTRPKSPTGPPMIATSLDAYVSGCEQAHCRGRRCCEHPAWLPRCDFLGLKTPARPFVCDSRPLGRLFGERSKALRTASSHHYLPLVRHHAWRKGTRRSASSIRSPALAYPPGTYLLVRRRSRNGCASNSCRRLVGTLRQGSCRLARPCRPHHLYQRRSGRTRPSPNWHDPRPCQGSGKSDFFDFVERRPFNGLAEEKPARALARLPMLPVRNDIPIFFWSAFLSAEKRKSDSTRLARTIGGRLASLPPAALSTIAYPVAECSWDWSSAFMASLRQCWTASGTRLSARCHCVTTTASTK